VTGDFIVGLAVGGMVGAALGVLLMAALVVASANGVEVWGERGGADVAGGADLDGDADGAVGDGGTVAAKTERANFYYGLYTGK
jgi:hypothetical protein